MNFNYFLFIPARYLFKQGGWIDLSMNLEASPGWVGNHQIDPQESDYSEEEVLQDKYSSIGGEKSSLKPIPYPSEFIS